jgi:transposase
LGFVVHRWFFGSGIPGRCWGFKKNSHQHSKEPKDHALGRSRGGFGSKFHLVTDGRGLPLVVEVTAGQRHESTQVETLLDGIAVAQPVGRPRKRPKSLAGDKAYSFPSVRQWLQAHGIKPVIPRRSNQRQGNGTFDSQSYRRRCVIEQCVGWLKECRRIATRFEKLAVSFLAMLKLAMIQRYLKLAFSDRA